MVVCVGGVVGSVDDVSIVLTYVVFYELRLQAGRALIQDRKLRDNRRKWGGGEKKAGMVWRKRGGGGGEGDREKEEEQCHTSTIIFYNSSS